MKGVNRSLCVNLTRSWEFCGGLEGFCIWSAERRLPATGSMEKPGRMLMIRAVFLQAALVFCLSRSV
ncbi:hypothetical protein [Paenibacillus pinihumi]|uniref:hypothetical protein n=1 Tax=Paenibacillus pinihumi TaxID=669462 RepID=UPI0012B645E1|nr:hypothetical protein [Paenibacillus pinihumi]